MSLEASLAPVRGLNLISRTHCDVLLLFFKILNKILHSKTFKSCICYFLFYIVVLFLFSTYFFYNISILSHLVYIILSGETDGVTLSRLGCNGMLKTNNLSKNIHANVHCFVILGSIAYPTCIS